MSNLLLDNNIVLKDNNPWSYFDGVNSQISTIGTTSTLAALNNGIFRIEFDIVLPALNGANKRIFGTTTAATGNGGIWIIISSAAIRAMFSNGSGTYGYDKTASAIPYNTPAHVLFYGTGSLGRLYITTAGNTVIYDSGETILTPPAVPADTTALAPFISLNTRALMYLRNFKIYSSSDTSKPIMWLPLQDPLNIGKDVIGGVVGTPASVTVVNQLETENWAYFDGVTSFANIGTTSTLGWMNSGVFNMEFEMVSHLLNTTVALMTAPNNASNKGFYLYSNYTFRWMNASGIFGCAVLTLVNSATAGSSYRITIRGDGSSIYYTSYNSDGSVNKTNEPTGDSCTFIPQALMNLPLYFGAYSTSFGNIKLRNFKLYTDYAGTIPFMKLPLQNAENLMTDTVGGLQGIAKDVSIVNNNTNILRSKNLWCRLGDDTTGLGNVYPVGSVSSFNWIHQTGIFRIEWEWTISNLTLSDIPFTTRVAAAANGIYPAHSNLLTGSRFYVTFGSGGVNLLVNTYWDVFYATGIYKMIMIGDGTGITLWASFNGGTLTNYGKLNFTGPIVPSGDAGLAMCIGGYTSNYGLRGSIRNLKFYNTQDQTGLVYHFPLTDGGKIGKDIKGVLNGTTQGELKVVEV